jgi:hypothetical protein
MTVEQIPFGAPLASGLDPLTGASPSVINVIVDAGGTVRRRPGIRASSLAPSTAIDTEITSVHATLGGRVYATGAITSGLRPVYRVGATSTAALGTNSLSQLLGSAHPTVVETDSLLVWSAGDIPQKVVLSSDLCSRLQGNAGRDPPKASHIAYAAAQLWANDADNPAYVFFSAPSIGTDYGGHEIWSTGSINPTYGESGVYLLSAKPDDVVAVAESTNEIFIFGESSLQVLAMTNLQDWASSHEYGCGARYSIIKVDERFAYIDQYRRFVVTDGRGVQDITGEIAKTLEDIETWDDCFGYRVQEREYDILVWTFPTDGRTFAYNLSGKHWAQWHGRAGGNWSRFKVNAHTVHQPTSQNLVGTTDGYVSELSASASTDLGDDIVAHVETGFRTHGTTAKKWCRSVRMTFKRGTTTGTSEPVAWLQWADEPGQWKEPRAVSLGVAGEVNPVVKLYSLGTYRQRAWRLIFSGSEELALIRADEEFEISEV